jgi:rfaE bifunctional protein nucleotidyltransferase chain/domain
MERTTVTREDIFNNKLRSPEGIRRYLDLMDEIRIKHPKDCGKSAVLGGCYDLLHPGHLDLIAQAYMYEFEDGTYIDTLIIALNSDASVKILKGPNRPIINQEDRAFFLASLTYVDYVTIFEEPIIDDVLKTIRPDYFIKSDQYSIDTLTANERQLFKDYNIEPLFLPFYNTYSTTHLINQMEANLKGLKCICAERLNKEN